MIADVTKLAKLCYSWRQAPIAASAIGLLAQQNIKKKRKGERRSWYHMNINIIISIHINTNHINNIDINNNVHIHIKNRININL